MQPQVSIVIRKYFLLIILICLSSCSETTNENCEDSKYKIVLKIIENKISYPYVPPPPANSDVKELINDPIKFRKWIESNSVEKSGKYAIAVKPDFWKPTKIYLLDSSYAKDYQLLVNQLTIQNESKVLIEKIETSEKYSLKYAPSNDSLRLYPELWKNYDFVISFSQISFNDMCDKAVLIYGVGFGKLNGYSVLVLMEKKSEVWEVRHTVPLTIS